MAEAGLEDEEVPSEDVTLGSKVGVRLAVMKITSSVEGSRPRLSELSMDMGT